ncbi:SulP family inorganic anion transporter [Namhaeicola litoreus]|uniref:SulP family inorganic anion transporter n=1 Tax=Namhaeicola litoreus TaxID=1052145 RepID=A0ABW3Y0G2_9FLAO
MTFTKIFPFLNWIPIAKKHWKDDLIAGITGTIIVIPQAVAFAIIAGLPPQYGFYTAMIVPVIAALFGSSHHLISGPTTAMSIVVFATISKFADPTTELEAYVGLTLVLTFMTGVFQLSMGLANMGKLVNFVSHSVILGFTAGAGILIAFKQLKHIFGLPVPQGSSFYEILSYIATHIRETNWYVFLVAMSTLAFALIIKKIKVISRYSMLIAMILGSVLAYFLGGESKGIETIGEITGKLPQFKIPELSLEKVKTLSSGALTLALLGLIEAVAIARSITLKSHQRIDSNQEFLGQGLSNIIGSFFSSYAGSGSFTRSGVNYQAGAKTPMAAIFASFFLVIVLLLFSGFAAYLATPVMGGIILLVGYNLIDFEHIKQVFKTSQREIFVLATTLFGTLFFELETALLGGIALSLFFYLERTAKPNIAVMGLTKDHLFINTIRDPETKECPQLKIVRIDGSIYFGALEVISDYFNNLYQKNEVKNVLVIAKGINFVDLAGATWLEHEVNKWRARGGNIYFSGLKIVSQDVLTKGGFLDHIGQKNFFKDKKTAIAEIYKNLDEIICENCTMRIFHECKTY